MPESRSSSHLGLYRSGLTGSEHRHYITVGREALIQDTLEILRRNLGKRPKHHQLFIGPRGIGKTHLLSLIEDGIEQDPSLSAGYHVVRFPEESHRTLSFADFLLGICEILRDTLANEPQWVELHARLITEDRDEVIADSLVPAIRQRRQKQGQVLVIMMENLNRIFEQQMRDSRSVAALRGFLMEDNGCLLVATAPLHFGAVTDPKEPFFDFFDVQVLDQLTEEETINLIRRNLEWEKRDELLKDFARLQPRIRALYRMTGGNPRLSLMLYELIANEAVTEVKQQLQILLDRITPFYQDRMNDLGPQERAILENLALMREQPKTPVRIAERMRMKTSQVSSLLGRLTKAQYLRSVENPKDKRSRLYTIREGFFDIWLAMNLSRGARRRMPFLLEFFEEFYPSLDERNRKRTQYRQSLSEARVEEGRAGADFEEGLDYLSEVGSGEEKAGEKVWLAGFHAKRGNATRAAEYIGEARGLPIDSMGGWILDFFGASPLPDYLGEMEAMVNCWEAYRDGGLEAFAEKLHNLGMGLNFKSWSEVRIDFLRDHLELLPIGKERVELRLNLGNLLFDFSRWAYAEEQLRIACKEAEETENSVLISMTLCALGRLLNITNRIVEAESIFRKALQVAELNLGESHRSVAIILNNLAQLLQDKGESAEAESHMRRSLGMIKIYFGEDHPTVALALNNLAQLLRATDRIEEAGQMMNQSVGIIERVLNPNHPFVAVVLHNLAELHVKQGRMEIAETLLRQAVKIEEENFGENHPRIAIGINNLAGLLKSTGRFAEAEPLMRRALEINKMSFGEMHPKVALSANSLALLLLDTGRPDEADPLLQLAVEILLYVTHENGFRHPFLLRQLVNYHYLCNSMDIPHEVFSERVKVLGQRVGFSVEEVSGLISEALGINIPGNQTGV